MLAPTSNFKVITFHFHLRSPCNCKFQKHPHPTSKAYTLFRKACGRCNKSLSIRGAMQKSLNPSGLFVPLINIKNKRWNLGLTLHPPPFNKTRNLLPSHLTTLSPFPPSQLHHRVTFSIFPTSPTSYLFHFPNLTTLPPTMKSFQNKNIRSSLYPQWF